MDATCAATPDIENAPVTVSQKSPAIHTAFVKSLMQYDPPITNKNELHAAMIALRKKYRISPSKLDLCTAYRELLDRPRGNDNGAASVALDKNNSITPNYTLSRLLITKAVRSESGILNISVSLPPDRFSCKYNCYFCPNEPGMPRSYLSNEDVFSRAAEVDFNTIKQVYNRLDVLHKNGHPIDKIEFRVLGGTFSCYAHAIADEFIRDLYYAANTYFGGRDRSPGTIEEEQAINTTAAAHVVGLGVETRPDEIDHAEIVRFRRYGVTRVELGVQHTDDRLLRTVNRGHGIKHSKRAIKLLKDYGFKIEIHIMTDLPGATPEGDMDCYRKVLRDDPDLIPDYMKDYPCLDVSFTTIKEWKETGQWKPYAEATPDASLLKEVLIYRQEITPKWVRVNRIQRDFRPVTHQPGHHIGYTSDSIKSNLAQEVKRDAEARGIYCQCIRCCEVRDEQFDAGEIIYNSVMFAASGAPEYFISAEVQRPHRNLMLGFCRLRISTALHDSCIPELHERTAMVRELHVYGKVVAVGDTSEANAATQHLGIGKQLLQKAENIAASYGMTQVAVISGIGVRDYYRRRGYELQGTYMIKDIPPSVPSTTWIISALIIVIAVFAAYVNIL